MRAKRLGCLTGTGIAAAFIAVAVITGVGFASGGMMFSPGPLNADQGGMLGGVSSHAEIAGNCEACHGVPWQVEGMDDRCIVCHDNVAAELGELTSIHGELYQLDPFAQCRDCHPEHNGAHASLTVLEEWNFPHQVTGYLLDGHQAKAEGEPFLCRDCHGDDVTSFDPSFCNACHAQIDMTFMLDHHLAFGGACLNCHDGLDTYGNDFTHNIFAFSLTGSHVRVLCSQCHLGSSKISDLKVAPQTCFACHQADDPHLGKLGLECVSCHSTEGWRPASFDHNRATFKLVGAHVAVACGQCHTDKFFVGTPTECFLCHQQDDPHAGRFGTECASCHNPTAWSDWVFDHSLTDFALTGRHVNLECEKCHTNGYHGAPQDCFSCHQQNDPHNGQLGRNCAECHNTSDWNDVSFDHNTTGFPLTGQHNNVTCQSCHANGQYRGTPTNCFACHASRDVHNGQFGTDCSACHVTSGWQNVNFDHNTTGFALTGQHQNAACTACHANGQFSGTPTNCFACHASNDAHNGQFGTECGACHVTGSWGNVSFDHNNTGFPLTGGHNNLTCNSCHSNGVYGGTPMDCYACHASDDNHGGQFGTNCAACHSTQGWGNASFDHSFTSFPLEGKHRGVSCESCHGNGVYQGLSTSCNACHRDEHNGENGTDCTACHSPQGWGD